jgi:hypothetical protein
MNCRQDVFLVIHIQVSSTGSSVEGRIAEDHPVEPVTNVTVGDTRFGVVAFRAGGRAREPCVRAAKDSGLWEERS